MSRWLPFLFGLGKGAALCCWLLADRAALGWAFFFAADLLVLFHLLVPAAQGILPVATWFETKSPEVWLTIDDGPDPSDTPRILAALAAHQARATFFLIGVRAERHPELVRDIVRAGHEVGHHTHTHPAGSLWCAGPRRLDRELDAALAAYAAASDGAASVRWFRAPVGIKNLFLGQALRMRRLACVHWTVRSWDSTARNAEVVVERVMRRVRPGAIILMHEGGRLHPSVRVVALSGVLERLRQQGFRCVLPAPERLRASASAWRRKARRAESDSTI